MTSSARASARMQKLFGRGVELGAKGGIRLGVEKRGLKLFERSTFLALPYFNHMHRFLPALVQQLGYGVLSVPVSHRPRIHGRSKYGVSNRLWAGLVDLAGVAWLARRNRRIPATEEFLVPYSGEKDT